MLEVGTMLAGRYELLEQIGSGGMAVVFRGMDLKLHREVAVKVMREDFINDPVQVEKFRKEAHAIAMLTHPNIVGVYDIGTEQGLEYMVKEYVDGLTLKEYIKRRHHMNSDEIVKVSLKIAEALKAAHESNIIHRDIKPQNVLVTPKGEVKVTDFGIAKFTNSGTITDHKETMGSVHYLSPEQARGLPVDERSDLYSLGITMYEMAVGRPPFDGDTPVAVAMQQLNTPTPPPREAVPGLWPGLETIIFGLTRKNPVDRYQSAAELIADLKKVYKDPSHGGIRERQTTPIAPSELKLKRHEEPKGGRPVQKTPAPVKKSFWEKYSIPILGSVLGLLVIVLAAVVVTGIMSSTQVQSGAGYLPNFVGKSVEAAQQEVESGNLNVRFAEEQTEIFSDAYEAGIIAGQTPDAGTQIPEGEVLTVTLTVSKGAREVSKVPDYLDNRYEDAIRDLAARGIRYRVEVAEDAGNQNGLIVDQSPRPGEELAEDTVVVLYVAVAQEELTEVPDLYNKTEEEAKALLEEAGLSVGTVTRSTSFEVAEGRIIAQGIASGRQVSRGSAIAITISMGAYEGASSEDAGAFLLNEELFGGTSLEEAQVKVVARVNGENETLLDQRLSREQLAEKEIWVNYPVGTRAIQVLLDDTEILNISVGN